MAGSIPPLPFAYQLYRLLWTSLDLLFPPVCAGCQQPGHRWCHSCRQKSKRIQENVCQYCGEPLQQDKNCCEQCRAKRPVYRAARSWGCHEGVLRQALHQLKYRRDIALGEVLARELMQLVLKQGWQVEVVVPVPLGRQRQKQRGYNQAALLARPLALALAVPYRPQALRRVRETRTQVGLSRQERRDNVKEAFYANTKHINERAVLLVDDVMTTGATLDAAAYALRKSGAAEVWAATMARAV